MRHDANESYDSVWTTDTGATHHFTNDANNISLQKSNYNGADTVHVGNGQGLQISQTGSSLLSTPSSTFVLNQILLVPEIRQNLLSVHNFALIITYILNFTLFIFL